MKYCLACGKELKDENCLYHDTCFKAIFGDSTVYDSIKDVNENLRKQIQSKKTVTGVQEKFSLTHVSKTSTRKTYRGKSFNYIIKLPNSNYKNITVMENLVMNMATTCKINVVPHALYPIDSNYLYITKRIDRDNGKKVPMEDFCQLEERLSEEKYKGSYEGFIHVIDKYSSLPKIDKVELLYRILFCFITGNNDMHLKNFSLIETRDNYYQLSPAYDLLNVALLNPRDKEEVALTINGKKKNLHRKDFLFLASSYGISETIYSKLVKQLASFQEKLNTSIDESLLDEKMKNDFKMMLDERLKRL